MDDLERRIVILEETADYAINLGIRLDKIEYLHRLLLDKAAWGDYIKRIEEKEAFIMKGIDAVYKDICDKYNELIGLICIIRENNQKAMKNIYNSKVEKLKCELADREYDIECLKEELNDRRID